MQKDFKYGKDGKKPGRYPAEIRDQAVSLFASCAGDYKTRNQAAGHIADLLGVGSSDTVMRWVLQAETDDGKRSGATTMELEEIRHLRRENAELRRANGILKAASAFFAAELDRPQKM
jgi:transposase